MSYMFGIRLTPFQGLDICPVIDTGRCLMLLFRVVVDFSADNFLTLDENR